MCDYSHFSRSLFLRSTVLRRHTIMRTLPNTSHKLQHTHKQTHFLAQTYIQKLITDSGDWLQKTVKVRRLTSLKVPGATTLNETTVLT